VLPFTFEWVKTAPDREIIAHRTVQHGQKASYRVQIVPAPAGDALRFLVLGDSGDSDRFALGSSPQEAVAREMARDAGRPNA
jgi:hypothetical protein